MPRGRLFFIPGIAWHITHRCHNRSFLLKFQRDKRRWLDWLLKVKKVYGLTILNYTLTSNHIHLLVYADQRRWVIPRSMQVVAGRTGWEYNRRKNRRGAFWEGAYNATAVQSDHHLFECMVYIDLNMVRTGVVSHPREWKFCGYFELMSGRQRYCLIDKETLAKLMGESDIKGLRESYGRMIEDALAQNSQERDARWTESIAVGEKSFSEDIEKRLGFRGRISGKINTRRPLRE